jgi:cold shock protein
MPTGSIKFFNPGKGFGFVTPDGGDSDIFLPAAALASSGLQSVKQGQRVTFEQAPDAKGPKVVTLKLLGDPPAKAEQPAADRLTIYCDPGSDVAADVLNEVRAAGYRLQLHDYVATPMAMEQLRRLSRLVSDAGQNLVRRYDPLFLALQLDDRFISDQDFWTGIAEHPSLINGPVLMQDGHARICRSAEEVRQFLKKGVETAPGPKTLSPRVAALLKGEALPPAPIAANEDVVPAKATPPAAPAPKLAKPMPVKAAPAKLAPKPKAAAKPAAKPVKKIEKKPAPKKASKPVKKAKKPAKR